MSFIVTIVHVGVSLFLMLTVLLQAGKGGGMGATFGGGSSQGSVFGGSGAGNFLSKLTTVSAAIFMLTSMTLAYLASTTGDDPLKNVSREARASAAQKKKLDQQALDLMKSTEPDAGLTDVLPSDSTLETIAPESEDGVDDAAESGAENFDSKLPPPPDSPVNPNLDDLKPAEPTPAPAAKEPTPKPEAPAPVPAPAN